MAQWIKRLLWTAVVSALLLLATYVSLGRYYIPYVEQYQQPLIQRFVELTGLKITVDRLHAYWSQLAPVFVIEQFNLYGPAEGDDAVLSAVNISFQIDVIDSFLNAAIQFKNVHIDGVECSLEQTASGGWQLKGYPFAAKQNTDVDALVHLALSADDAQVNDARLHMFYQQDEDEDALLWVQQLFLEHHNNFRRFRLQATLNDSENPLTGIIEAQGDPRRLDTFSARAYLKLDKIDFAAQLPLMRGLGIDLHDARIDSELWLNWQPGSIISAQGYLSTPVLDIAALGGEALAPLNDLHIQFRVEKTAEDHWHAWLPELSAQWYGQPLSFQQLEIDLTPEQARFSVPEVSLDTRVRQLMATELLTESTKELLASLSMRGELNNVHLSLNRTEATEPQTATRSQFRVIANLNDVGVSPWRGAPGAEGVSGYVELTPSTGIVELDARQFSLDFPVVYQQPLNFQSGRGQLRWQVEEHRVTVNSGPLYLVADEGNATGLLSLDLPLNHDSGDPLMTLIIGLQDADANYRHKLIPYTLNQGFLDWMASSVPVGHVIDGGFIYRGSLRKDAIKDRTVQLYFNVDDTTLDYHPDWPQLTEINGLVLIDDGAVEVKTEQARLYQLEVAKAHVRVVPQPQKGMWLTVDASASGAASDALRLVNESYIRTVVGTVFENWQLDGKAVAELKLGIPLAGADRKPDIDVAVQLTEAGLQIPAYRLQFTDLSGPINYRSEQGISSAGIAALLYGRPLMATVAQSDQVGLTVDINGRLAMSDVADWSRQAALSFVAGETDFNARVLIAARAPDAVTDADQSAAGAVGNERLAANNTGAITKHSSEFTVASTLQGVSINLPAPYKKTAGKALPFWLKMPLGEDKPLLKMGLDNQAEVQLQFEQGQVKSGLVILDKTQDLQHRDGYFTVTGQVRHFDLSLWEPVLDRYLAQADLLRPKPSNPPQSGDVLAEDDSLQVSVRELSLKRFKGFGRSFENALIDAQRNQQGWWIAADNTMFDAELRLPDDTSAPMQLKLKRLHLPEGFVGDESGGGLSSIDLGDLGELAVDVVIDDLMLGDESYGSMAFELRTENGGLILHKLMANIRGIQLGAKGTAALEWLPAGGGYRSRLYGDFGFTDLGKVLEKWNYETIIKTKSGAGSLDLTWPGRPDQWLLETSEGPLYLTLKEGRFLKASDTASGTLKVVGIVNLSNIIRRLQLDFSDVYKSGVSFDSIEGELLLSDKELIIVDDFSVEAPSSRFHFKGKANMVARELDMEMITTLPVANNLPWIAALAGGLPTAAGVYVASKVFEDQFNRLSSAVYTVKGDWNNPQLEFRRVFDTTKKNTDSAKADSAKVSASSSGELAEGRKTVVKPAEDDTHPTLPVDNIRPPTAAEPAL
jgi:uncharacterized protein YhdP